MKVNEFSVPADVRQVLSNTPCSTLILMDANGESNNLASELTKTLNSYSYCSMPNVDGRAVTIESMMVELERRIYKRTYHPRTYCKIYGSGDDVREFMHSKLRYDAEKNNIFFIVIATNFQTEGFGVVFATEDGKAKFKIGRAPYQPISKGTIINTAVSDAFCRSTVESYGDILFWKNNDEYSQTDVVTVCRNAFADLVVLDYYDGINFVDEVTKLKDDKNVTTILVFADTAVDMSGVSVDDLMLMESNILICSSMPIVNATEYKELVVSGGNDDDSPLSIEVATRVVETVLTGKKTKQFEEHKVSE